jgi:hypothetical protein
MALIPENGTGLANANTYADYAYFIAFCDQFGLAGTYTEEQAEPALTTSSIRCIDMANQFAGNKLVDTQALEFPRDNDIGLPSRIKDAASLGAWLILTVGSPFNTSILGEISSERKKLDVLETEKTYIDGTKKTNETLIQSELFPYLSSYLKLSTGFGRVVRVI